MHNPIQTMLRFKKFQFFFSKIFFFCFYPYTAQVRQMKSAKNNLCVLSYAAKKIQTILGNQIFFKTFLKI